MSGSDRELARLGVTLADRLEDAGWREAGIVRQLARRLVELAPADLGGKPMCARDGCGRVVERQRMGRPRKFCERCSPAKQRKSPEKSRLAA